MSWANLRSKVIQYLTPPGEGVFTVNTAKDRKNSLQKTLYGNASKAETKWKSSLKKLPSQKVSLLGITSDSGGGILRGANWGPLFFREALYKEISPKNIFDFGDIRTIPHLLHDKYLKTETIKKCRKSLYGKSTSSLPVSPLSICEDFCKSLYSIDSNIRLLGIGGDHSVSYPLVKEFLIAKKKKNINIGLVHFDAHTDLLEERLGIDICFGSWTSHIISYLKKPQNLVQIGIRSTGKSKSFWQKKFGLIQYWAKDVKKNEPKMIAKKIIDHYKKNKIHELYISFDIDALDIKYASSTGTPEAGGLTPTECKLIINELAKHFPVTGADIVEFAPFVNHGQKNSLAQTSKSIMIIAKSLLNAMEKEI